jgi:hypothetical protein
MTRKLSRSVDGIEWLIACSQLRRIAEDCASLQLCPSFTAVILTSLPRELRDQVYVKMYTFGRLDPWNVELIGARTLVTITCGQTNLCTKWTAAYPSSP